MNPRQCGTFGVPEGSPDAGEVSRFREFLAAVDQHGIPAVVRDPKWAAYVGRELVPASATAGELGDLVTITAAGDGFRGGYPDAAGERWRDCDHEPHATRLAALHCAERRMREDAGDGEWWRTGGAGPEGKTLAELDDP